MRIEELKEKLIIEVLHTLNEKALNECLETLSKVNYKKKEGKLWAGLSEEHQQEVLLSLEESEDDSNLISNEEVMKQYKNGLSNNLVKKGK